MSLWKRISVILLTVMLLILQFPVNALAYSGNNYGSTTVGASKYYDLATDWGVNAYSFVPSTTGFYTFYSYSKSLGDPYFYLCSSGNYNTVYSSLTSNGYKNATAESYSLALNDDSGGDGNFSLTYWCAANTTYYCILTKYSTTRTAAYFNISGPSYSSVSLNNQSATTAGTTSYYVGSGYQGLVAWMSTSSTSNFYSITVPSKTGYTFGGYYTSTGGGGTQVINASGSILNTNSGTLYAKWTANAYTVSFSANSGSGGQTANVTATYNSAMPAITTTVPTRTGYTFGGYYDTSASTGGTQYYTAACASARAWDKTAATTLYARWTPNTYTISFSANSGSGGQTTNVAATYDSAMPAITTTAPTRTGYTFGGYYDTSASTGGTQYYTAAGASARTWNKTAAASLYARWTANTYIVTLNPQSGTGGTASVSTTYAAAMPSMTKPIRAGYTFGGYFTGTNGSGTKYYNADGTSARLWDQASAATLNAYWVQDTSIRGTVTIGYTYNGGENSVPANTRASSAELTLWRKTTGDFSVLATQKVTFSTVDDSYTQSYQFTSQPAIDAGGNPYTYKVTADLSNYDVSYSDNDITLSFNPNNFDASFVVTPQNDVVNPPASIKLKILWRNYGDAVSGYIISQHANVYVEAAYNAQTGTYSGSYPVWKSAPGGNPYEYQLLLLDDQGLANITYGKWIKWSGTAADGVMTASFGMKTQTIVRDNTSTENGFSVTEQSNLDKVIKSVVTPADIVGDNTVTLSLNISDITSQAIGVDAIKTVADKGSEVYFFDATLTKAVDNGSTVEETTLTQLSVPLEMHIFLTGDLAGKTYYRVYRYHDGRAEEISSDTSSKEHYIVDVAASEIIIYTTKFSTYAIFGNDQAIALNESYDVDVQAKVKDGSQSIYKIDIAWGAMTFEYERGADNTWDPDTHTYEGSAASGWLPTGFDGENNRIMTWNHSNRDVLVSFEVTRNSLDGVNMVVNQTNSLLGMQALNLPLGRVPNEMANAENIDAYLLLSGEPEDMEQLGATYSKVAIITATIKPSGGELTPRN